MNAEREIRDFLLGRLPAERREEVERRILVEDEFHLEIEIVENELLDDYVRERLVESERRLFELNFLASPLRRQRLKLARAFQDKINAAAVPALARIFTGRLYPYALAASLVLAAFTGALSYRALGALQQERARTALLSQQIEHAAPAAQVASNAVILAELAPRSSRGGPQPQLVLPKNILAVRFILTIPGNIQGPVRVDLVNDAGQQVISQQGNQTEREQDHNLVTATIDSKYLNPGDYVLRITPPHSSSLPEYPFQVLHPRGGLE
jgi:hypothetical protein